MKTVIDTKTPDHDWLKTYYYLRFAVSAIWVALAFGIVGYVFKKLDYPIAPLILASGAAVLLSQHAGRGEAGLLVLQLLVVLRVGQLLLQVDVGEDRVRLLQRAVREAALCGDCQQIGVAGKQVGGQHRHVARLPDVRPDKTSALAALREIIESKAWAEAQMELPVVLGVDSVTNKPVIQDLAKMPHALIAGATGQGKSVCINAIIVSLLYRCTPQDLRFIMVDPKVVELQIYNNLPHLLIPVETDAKRVPAALNAGGGAPSQPKRWRQARSH